jgi:hypothetical protein
MNSMIWWCVKLQTYICDKITGVYSKANMVCPMCITAFVVSNAPFIVGTGAAAICAVKLKQVPEPRKIVDRDIVKKDKPKTFADRYSMDDDL